jgi:hypothetical protein
MMGWLGKMGFPIIISLESSEFAGGVREIETNISMMKPKTLIKSTALLLTLFSLFISGLIMIEAGGHALQHGHTASHAAQHASLICTWMCAASTALQSEDPRPIQRIAPSSESVIVSPGPFFSRSVPLVLRVRPPPFSLI